MLAFIKPRADSTHVSHIQAVCKYELFINNDMSIQSSLDIVNSHYNVSTLHGYLMYLQICWSL